MKEKEPPQEFNLLAELAPAKLASYYKKVYNQKKKWVIKSISILHENCQNLRL